MKQDIFYHLFDHDTQDVMNTGLNSTTLEDLKESLLSYIEMEDIEDEDLKAMKDMDVYELAAIKNMSVEETHCKLNDGW